MLAHLRLSAAAAATLALLALFAAEAPGRAQGLASSGLSSAYQALVDRCRSGDRDGAVEDLGRWPDVSVQEVIPALRGRASITRLTLALGDDPRLWAGSPLAALMLHTDCAAQARRVASRSRETIAAGASS
jgi:hypothetical protein